MPDNLIPDELARAARTLEERFVLLKVPSRKIQKSEWSALPGSVQQLIPAWIPALLSEFAIAEGVLEYRDRNQPSVRQFSFFNPSEYESELAANMLFHCLPKFGYLPFAYEHNGSVWVLKPPDGPSGPICLLDLPDWNGAEPSPRNGLVFASNRLALLFASMGVSEVSYYESPGGVTSVLWYEEK